MQIKNRKLFLALASVISANLSFSQSYTIIPGEERVYNKKEEGIFFKSYLETDGKTLYTNRGMSEQPGETEMITRVELNNPDNTPKVAKFKLDASNRDLLTEVELQRAICNNKACIVTSAFKLDEKKKVVYVRNVEFNGLLKKNDQTELLSIDCDKKRSVAYNFNAVFSPDRSKLLIICIYYKGSEKIEVIAHTFDVNSWKKISEVPLYYSLNGEDLNFGDFLICNNGD